MVCKVFQLAAMPMIHNLLNMCRSIQAVCLLIAYIVLEAVIALVAELHIEKGNHSVITTTLETVMVVHNKIQSVALLSVIAT